MCLIIDITQEVNILDSVSATEILFRQSLEDLELLVAEVTSTLSFVIECVRTRR